MTDPTPRDAVAALLGPLQADIDTMRDVYLSRAQREAFDRIVAAALLDRPAPAAAGDAVGEIAAAGDGTHRVRMHVKAADLPAGTKLYAALAAAPAAPVLWCMHILGPDDVIPAPSREHAQKAADLANDFFARNPGGEYSPVMRAEVAPWPHDAASHAASVGEFITNWMLPRSQTEAAAAPAAGGEDELPAILFDGHAVYAQLDGRQKARTSPENVADVLDAVVRAARKEPTP